MAGRQPEGHALDIGTEVLTRPNRKHHRHHRSSFNTEGGATHENHQHLLSFGVSKATASFISIIAACVQMTGDEESNADVACLPSHLPERKQAMMLMMLAICLQQ